MQDNFNKWGEEDTEHVTKKFVEASIERASLTNEPHKCIADLAVLINLNPHVPENLNFAFDEGMIRIWGDEFEFFQMIERDKFVRKWGGNISSLCKRFKCLKKIVYDQELLDKELENILVNYNNVISRNNLSVFG